MNESRKAPRRFLRWVVVGLALWRAIAADLDANPLKPLR